MRFGASRTVDPWQVAVVEHSVQIEFAPELARRQAVELVAHGPPTEQVGRAALHLARARPAKREVKPSVLDEPMHFVEQRRNFLDFVDDDLAPGPGLSCLESPVAEARGARRNAGTPPPSEDRSSGHREYVCRRRVLLPVWRGPHKKKLSVPGFGSTSLRLNM